MVGRLLKTVERRIAQKSVGHLSGFSGQKASFRRPLGLENIG